MSWRSYSFCRPGLPHCWTTVRTYGIDKVGTYDLCCLEEAIEGRVEGQEEHVKSAPINH